MSRSRHVADALHADLRARPESNWVRQAHRWLSIAFTVAVIVNLVALGQEEPAAWVGLLALLPLALLMFTGLYLFVLPYAKRHARPSGPR